MGETCNNLVTKLATDCVSRQVVKKVLKDWYENLIVGSLNGLIKRIDAIPSTEPQITECEHCLAYDPFENGVDGFCRKMGKVMCVSDFCSYAERRAE